MKKLIIIVAIVSIISTLVVLYHRNYFLAPNAPATDYKLIPKSHPLDNVPAGNTSGEITSSPTPLEKPQAYVTMVFDDQSTIGAFVMISSLKYVKSAYPLVILVTKRVSQVIRDQYTCLGATVIEIPVVSVPSHVRLQLQWWVPSFTKLQIWSLSDYSKLVWVDGDSVIMKNIDELFLRPELTAAQDYNGVELLPNKICGGLMVIVPSEKNYQGLMDLLYNDKTKQWNNGEQQLVDYYYQKNGNIEILDSTWSTFVNTMCPSPEVQRVAHFTHWGVSIEHPMSRDEALRHQNCDREYYLRWVDMYEESMRVLKEKNQCK